MRVK
jgi:hypothetical protein